MRRWDGLFLVASRGSSQAFGGGIMTDGIESTPELFVQVRQITMGFLKIRGPLQCLRIGREGSAFILLILEHHRQVEMRECGVRPILQRAAIAGLGFFEIPGVMMEQAEIDTGLHKSRL